MAKDKDLPMGMLKQLWQDKWVRIPAIIAIGSCLVMLLIYATAIITIEYDLFNRYASWGLYILAFLSIWLALLSSITFIGRIIYLVKKKPRLHP